MKFGRQSLKKCQGFTSVELLVTIAIFAVLAAIAIPAFSAWIPNYRLNAAARDLISNFQRAKMEAVRRNTQVVLSFSPQVYVPEGGVGTYQIFVDDGTGGGTAGNFIRDGGETLLVQATMPSNASLYSAGFTGSTTAAGFNSRGLPASNRTGNVALRNNKSRYYQASLSVAGNISLKTSNDGVTWN